MSNVLSTILMAVAVALVVFAVLEHFLLRLSLFPHFGVYLGLLALILATWGIYGKINNSSGTL